MIKNCMCLKTRQYINCRPNKSGGGVMLLVKPTLRSALHPFSRQVLSDKYNLCAVKSHNCSPLVTLVVVYRPPNAINGDKTAMFQDLSGFLSASGSEVILVGDFNIVRD